MAHKALLLVGNGPYLSVSRAQLDQESDPAMMRQMADTVLQLLDALLANLLAKVSGQFQVCRVFVANQSFEPCITNTRPSQV